MSRYGHPVEWVEPPLVGHLGGDLSNDARSRAEAVLLDAGAGRLR